MADIIASSNINETEFRFFLSTNKDIVPLSKLSITDLLVELTASTVNINFITKLMEVLIYGLSVLVRLFRDRYNNALSRTHPEGPFTSKMLDEDSHEAFYRTENSSMHNDRSLETRLKMAFLPSKVFFIVFVSLKQLFS